MVGGCGQTSEMLEGSGSVQETCPREPQGPPAAVPHVPVPCSSSLGTAQAADLPPAAAWLVLTSNPIRAQNPTSAGLVLAGAAYPLGRTRAMACIGTEQLLSVVPATAGPAWLQVI